jgi:hypothetical protein
VPVYHYSTMLGRLAIYCYLLHNQYAEARMAKVCRCIVSMSSGSRQNRVEQLAVQTSAASIRLRWSRSVISMELNRKKTREEVRILHPP